MNAPCLLMLMLIPPPLGALPYTPMLGATPVAALAAMVILYGVVVTTTVVCPSDPALAVTVTIDVMA